MILNVQMFNELGDLIESSQKHPPAYLDWMHIDVVWFWYQQMGEGHPDTKHVFLRYQGQQKLFHVTRPFVRIDGKIYKEKLDGAEEAVREFIDRYGYSRTPRNQ